MDLLDDLPVFLGASFDCAVSLPSLVPLNSSASNLTNLLKEDDSSGSINTSSDNATPDEFEGGKAARPRAPAGKRGGARKGAGRKRRDEDEEDDDFYCSDSPDEEDDVDEEEVVPEDEGEFRGARAASNTSSSGGGGRGRKKKAKAEPAEGVDPNTSVTLSRERLLTITSQEYDSFLAAITRPLTPAETAEARRQRRLIKNRESAALSRNRKRQAMEVLEEENAKLRAELAKIKAKLERYERQPAPTAGVLFVVLFSVGLFWGSGMFGGVAAPGAESAAFAPSDIANLRRLMSHEQPSVHCLCSGPVDMMSNSSLPWVSNDTLLDDPCEGATLYSFHEGDASLFVSA